ncbi:hypothetical protein LSAT2_030491 [Lamellibrachia satsuma]|nr:hypothetical protein LSAT2_030491 [Lamellibrachia satsuma]
MHFADKSPNFTCYNQSDGNQPHTVSSNAPSTSIATDQSHTFTGQQTEDDKRNTFSHLCLISNATNINRLQHDFASNCRQYR